LLVRGEWVGLAGAKLGVGRAFVVDAAAAAAAAKLGVDHRRRRRRNAAAAAADLYVENAAAADVDGGVAIVNVIIMGGWGGEQVATLTGRWK
jgi:D-arabinose 1-dehydrogenase-like Zn-dependent alcohol dehydrogenase